MKRIVIACTLSLLTSLFCLAEVITPVKSIVEGQRTSRTYTVKAAFVKVHDENALMFLVEEDQYIIPVKLKKQDLGAVDRFKALGLEMGDTVIVTGAPNYLRVRWEDYIGLTEATILEVRKADKEVPQQEEEVIPPEPEFEPQMAFPGMTESRSNAHLQGRKVDGQLVAPNYKRQESGVVVVSIWVDVYGNVQKAIPGAKGTTVKDANLWSEARSAAMRTHFTKIDKIEEDTPPLQEGTITYIFKLKSPIPESR